MPRPSNFTLTEQHVTLLRHFIVGWQDCETGAPEIDPKRPYGNSFVVGDIAEIFGEHPTGGDEYEPEFTEEQKSRLMKLHRETATALQIVLATGSFTPGDYVCEPYTRDWKLA